MCGLHIPPALAGGPSTPHRSSLRRPAALLVLLRRHGQLARGIGQERAVQAVRPGHSFFRPARAPSRAAPAAPAASAELVGRCRWPPCSRASRASPPSASCLHLQAQRTAGTVSGGEVARRGRKQEEARVRCADAHRDVRDFFYVIRTSTHHAAAGPACRPREHEKRVAGRCLPMRPS